MRVCLTLSPLSFVDLRRIRGSGNHDVRATFAHSSKIACPEFDTNSNYGIETRLPVSGTDGCGPKAVGKQRCLVGRTRSVPMAMFLARSCEWHANVLLHDAQVLNAAPRKTSRIPSIRVGMVFGRKSSFPERMQQNCRSANPGEC